MNVDVELELIYINILRICHRCIFSQINYKLLLLLYRTAFRAGRRRSQLNTSGLSRCALAHQVCQ